MRNKTTTRSEAARARRAEYARQWRLARAADPVFQAAEKLRKDAWRATEHGRQLHADNARRWRQRNPLAVLAQKRADHVRRYTGRDAASVEYLECVKNDPCAYCGGPSDTLDHIDPVYRGGANSWDNFTAACRRCNSNKHTRPLLTFLLAKAA